MCLASLRLETHCPTLLVPRAYYSRIYHYYAAHIMGVPVDRRFDLSERHFDEQD